MFNNGHEMRSVTVTPLLNISQNRHLLFFRTFLHFGSTKKVFPMKYVLKFLKTLLLNIWEMLVYVLNKINMCYELSGNFWLEKT